MKTFLFIITLLVCGCSPCSARDLLHYIGSGHVMHPSYMNGEIFNLYPLEYTYLKAGRVAAFRIEKDGISETVAHRLVRLEADGWVTKADGNDFEDTWRCTAQNYLGLIDKEKGETDLGHARILGKRLEKLYVINLWSGNSVDRATSPLTYVRAPRSPTHSVPEGSWTLGLLGVALVILFVIRHAQRFKQ